MTKEKQNEEKKELEDKKRHTMFSQQEMSRTTFARHGIEQLNLESTTITIGDYTQDDIRDFIETYNDKGSQDALLEISDILYVKSPHFRRLVQYFANMATLSYSIIPKEDIFEMANSTPETIREDYLEIGKFAKKLNMKHEFRKILLEVFKSEAFFGYVHYTDDDFYIQKIPRELCAISSVEEGVFNYSVYMPAVDDNIDIYKYTLPEEIITLYNEWVENEDGDNSEDDADDDVKKEEDMVTGDWRELSSENTIVVKFDEGNHDIMVPPFASSFESVYEIDGFKASRRNREQIDNYMMIFQKIPMRGDTESNNDFTIDYDSVGFFHGELADSVPDSVGVVTTPMDLEPIEFKKDSVDIDNVAKAEKGFWSSSGTSQALFSTENNTTQGIQSSIQTDEQIVFTLLRQLERWVERFTGSAHGESLFSIEILDITFFNQEEYYKRLLELSQYGIPVKTMIPNAMGIEPIQVSGMTHLENEVLGIHESWIPLQSSHTMSGKDIANKGKPETDDVEEPKEDTDDLSDEALKED